MIAGSTMTSSPFAAGNRQLKMKIGTEFFAFICA